MMSSSAAAGQSSSTSGQRTGEGPTLRVGRRLARRLAHSNHQRGVIRSLLLKWLPVYLLVANSNWWPPAAQLEFRSRSSPFGQVKCDDQQQQFDDQINFDVIPAQFDDHDGGQSSEQVRRQKSIMSYLVPSQQQQQQDDQQSQALAEDLLESQSSADSNTAPTSGSSSPAPGGASGGSSLSAGADSSASKQSSAGTAISSGSSGGGQISDQLNAVVSLLQQMGSNQQQAHLQQQQHQQPQQGPAAVSASAIADAIAASVSGSILNPIRSQTAAVGNIVRQTISGAGQRPAHAQRPAAGVAVGGSSAPAVGQNRPTIDGGIEYNPDTNTLDGFLEWPNLGGLLNKTSKPSLQSLKPYLLAGLKTVPLKVGAVGWKLLQLLAWKKVYKTHHGKTPTAELVIEEEIKPPTASAKSTSSKSMMAEAGAKLGKTSKMGHMFGGSGGGSGDGWPPAPEDNGANWPAAASMMMPLYQRHLLAQSATQAHHSHPATAAAAAAAATAAAIQSHWVQQQLANELAAAAASASSSSSSSSSSGDPLGPLSSEQHHSASKNSTAARTSSESAAATATAALTRRRTTRSHQPATTAANWFASPAYAYAAAANAAAAAAAHQQQQQHLWTTAGAGDQRHQLAGLLQYQNLFDNAAAMAVQSAVKLPHMSDFMAPNYGGSLMDSPTSSASDDVVDAWPTTTTSHSSAAAHLGAGGFLEGRSDSQQLQQQHQFAADVEFGGFGAEVQPPSSLVSSSMQDFDDTPAARYLGSALQFNSSSAF